MGKKIILTADIKEKATTKFGPFDPTTTLLLYALIIILGFEFVKGVRGKNFIFSWKTLFLLASQLTFRSVQKKFSVPKGHNANFVWNHMRSAAKLARS